MTNIVSAAATTESQSAADEAKTPFMLYVDSQKSGRHYNELKKEYGNLSIDQQYEWIVKAAELAPESIEKCLTKDEQRIYKGRNKHTPNAYNLYVKDTFDKMKQRTNNPAGIFSEIAQLWKTLDASKKDKYHEAALLVSQFVDFCFGI